ncbi:hypothetical protein SAMN05720472_1608 [Fibrobacter sp. UWR3]|uniref:hypothetical protein n=1 Tax=Fibrobacter sp. UWR3 TaxID=1896217 RepID=UPI00091655D2|nr:hypothetical protein [Fibrobacter sp. UWR3]SHM55111.1 hypothetical protein SAMN05720472_1608 [Fibrobacter sp. UWR3]
MKLQDAFYSEKSMYGGWGVIGYVAPGAGSSNSYASTNFTYAGHIDYATETNATEADAWTVTSKAALNDCPASSVWKIGVVQNAAGNTSKYSQALPTDADCKSLTPNFDQIGKS